MSRMMSHKLQLLTDRVKVLEEQVAALLAAKKTTKKTPRKKAA